ncbi:hypothetical protein ACFYMX_24895 [Streptomyces griseofuscus]|uniref:hypothetical protein n=1 Tax=Streptomyces griseofuscus TaxID=146922 RepID=UPI0033FE419E
MYAGRRVLLRSRRGTDMTAAFPEINTAANTQLPADTGLAAYGDDHHLGAVHHLLIVGARPGSARTVRRPCGPSAARRTSGDAPPLLRRPSTMARPISPTPMMPMLCTVSSSMVCGGSEPCWVWGCVVVMVVARPALTASN